MIGRWIAGAVALGSLMAGGPAMAGGAAGPRGGYAHERDIAAPDGRWDFATWDAAHDRVLIAHGEDVLVIDPAHGDAVRAIGAIAGAHIALALPGGERVLVTSGHDNTVRVLDAANGAQLASIPVAADPDAAILSADGGTAYVMAAKAGAVSVIDLARAVETARIAVKPGLEVPVWIDTHTLAINDEDANEIELVDTAAGKHTGAIALPGCTGPTGLAYAPDHHLALSACANGKAALVDMRAGKLVALLPIGAGPDTALWDARRQRFLVPCGKSGTLVTIAPHGRTGWRAIATSPSAASARTAALDPATGRIYLPAARFAPAAPGQRGALVPGSFRVVVLTPAP